MTILTTPVYGLGYISPDHPLNQLAEASQALATNAEAALVRGGIAPPAAQDLATLSGRVSTLEPKVTDLQLKPGRRLMKSGVQSITAAQWLLIVWENLAASVSGPGMWSSANPSRIVATKAGRWRLVVNITGGDRLMARQNAAGAVTGGTIVGGAAVGSAVAPGLLVVDELPLAVGEYVEVYGYNTAADTIGTRNGYTAALSLSYIGA